MRFSAEILGRVPYGLTHNDVFATIWQRSHELTVVESCTKRQLAGNHVSVKIVFHALNETEASKTMSLCKTAVYNFSADVIGLREI